MASLSVIINTKNSARYLAACLESVHELATEVVLVDMASTDETLAITGRFPKVRVHQYPHPEVGYADPAREFAFARASGDWLLIIDSDEQLPLALADLIRQVVAGAPPATLPPADCYRLARHNEIFGQFLDRTGWYPDYQVRLWRRGVVKWHSGVHSQPEIKGEVADFPAEPSLAIIHHNYQTISQFLTRLDKYTTAAAESAPLDRSTVTPDQLWQSFFGEWWRRAFADEGLLEGSHGLTLSLLQATYELVATAKVWQQQGFPAARLTPTQLNQLRGRFQRESRYWWADLMVKQTQGLRQWGWRVRRKLRW